MIQRKFLRVLAISLMVLLLQNCGSDELKPTAVSIYVGGQVKTSKQWVAGFSNNGVAKKVGSPDNVYSFAQSMIISGKDIYLAGYSDNVATYWKNSAKHTIPLSPGAVESDCGGGILVDGSDVYLIVREKLATGAASIKYVKNEVATVCEVTPGGNISTSAFGNGLAVSEGDVYVVGTGSDANDVNHAGYWKNGSFVSFGTDHSYGTAIKVVDGDIYVAGSYDDPANNVSVAAYWKNGNLVALGNAEAGGNSGAYDIEIADGIVHVSGSHILAGASRAVYWKDGEEFVLTPEPNDSYAENIEVRNGDVYVVAEYFITDVGFVTKLWKNNILVAPFDGTSTNFYGVALCIK